MGLDYDTTKKKQQRKPQQRSQQRPQQKTQQRSQQRPEQKTQQRPQQRPEQKTQQRSHQRPQQKQQQKQQRKPQRNGTGQTEPEQKRNRDFRTADEVKSIAGPTGTKRKAAGRTSGGPHRNGRKRRRRKSADIISTVVLIAAACVFVFSLYQLVMMLVPYYFGGQEYDEVKKLAITTEKQNGDGETEFQVDFDALLAENPDTVAWLRFDQPEIISYPVVKSADNNEYLTKTFTANDNKLGAIFMDMRNNSSFSDRNTFIYGHNLKMGGEMFSQLNEYASEEFCKENPYFYIYTPDGKTNVYQIFSAGVVKDTADNYKLTYATEQEYTDYLKLCVESSNYQVDVNLDASSKIVSLSTCTNVNDDERFLVQGVLVEERE